MPYDWRRQHPYTNLCRHTGLTIPECSCPVCTQRLMARANVRAYGGPPGERRKAQARCEHSHSTRGLAGLVSQETRLGDHRAQAKGLR
jgi:hypothetical protein